MKSYLPLIRWQITSIPPKLEKGTVHIWRADLNLNNAQLTALWKILDKEEQHRADRFKFPIHRQHFIASRGFLRKILAGYLKIPAEKIIFNYNSHGKPFLPKQFNSNLTFNNSASNDLALYAIMLNSEVGIDVEFVEKNLDYVGLVERFFSPAEKNIFQQLPAVQQKEAFFYGWVQKEAFVKALGTGLSFHLNNFDVNLKLNTPAQLIAINGDKEAAKNWQLMAFLPEANFVACLVVEGKIKNVNYLRFEKNTENI